MQLENKASSLMMFGIQNDANFEFNYGREARGQQLNMLRSDALKKHYEQNMTRKEDKMWWTSYSMDRLEQTSDIAGNVMGSFSKFGSFKQSMSKAKKNSK